MAGWPAFWLAAQLTGCLLGLLDGCPAEYLAGGWLAGWLIVWLAYWLSGWFSGNLIGWLSDWLTGCMAGLLDCWLAGWLTQFLVQCLIVFQVFVPSSKSACLNKLTGFHSNVIALDLCAWQLKQYYAEDQTKIPERPFYFNFVSINRLGYFLPTT